MTDRLRDKVAIVTGGGDGIGRGIVRRFAREGANVLVAEIDDDAGEAVASSCRDEFGADVRFVHTDASAKDDVTAMVATALQIWGTVDMLVNNAWGGGTLGRFESMTDEQMQWGLSMGLLGPFWGMQAVLPIMKAKRDGAVINLCSLNGVNAHMGTTSYNVAKEALRAASRTAAREWAPWQIRVNVICPGAKSAATREVFASAPRARGGRRRLQPHGPSRRPRGGHRAGGRVPGQRGRPLPDRQHTLRRRWRPHQRRPVGARPRRLSRARRSRPPVTLTSSSMDGLTAIVAGAGPGIGRACAAALRRGGRRCRDRRPGRRPSRDLGGRDRGRVAGRAPVVPLTFDFADLASCQALVDQTLDRFGRIDVLVNVATAGGEHTPIDEGDWESWRRAFEVNVIGTMELSRLAATRHAAGRARRRLHHSDRHHRDAGAPDGPGPLHGDEAGDGHGVPDPGQGARAGQRPGQRGDARLHDGRNRSVP